MIYDIFKIIFVVSQNYDGVKIKDFFNFVNYFYFILSLILTDWIVFFVVHMS